MKRIAFYLIAVAVVLAAGFALMPRRPLLPDMQDPLGLLPVIPGERRSVRELETALGSPEALVRREALRSFGRALDHGRLKPETVVPLLIDKAKDADPSVRAVSVTYLRNWRVAPASGQPVFIDLINDADPVVRMNAAAGLASIAKDNPAVKTVLEGLWNDASSVVRHQVAVGLWWHPESRYQLPEKWQNLSQHDARAMLRSMELSDGPEALVDAVYNGDVAGVMLLLAAGVDPNPTTLPVGKEPPLFGVYSTTRPEIVKALLEHGASLEARDKLGRTPLERAQLMLADHPKNPSFLAENLKLMAAGSTSR